MKTGEGQLKSVGASVEYVNNIPNIPPSQPFFSQVVWAGETAYLSGQIGTDPATGALAVGGIAAEAEKIFDNLEITLESVGLSFLDVAKVSVYLVEMDDFPTMNEIYARRMGKARPARETVIVKALARGAQIEITMTAFRRNSERR